MGLFSVGVLVVWHVLRAGYNISRVMVRIVGGTIYIAACFTGSYLLVNAYNLAVGGNWNTILEFIYPMMFTRYNTFDILRTSLPTVMSIYIVYIIVFIYTFAGTLQQAWFVGTIEECNDEENATFLRGMIALSGILQFVYFINRTAADSIVIAFMQFFLLMASYGEQIANRLSSLCTIENIHAEIRWLFCRDGVIFRIGMSTVAMFLVVIAAAEGIFGLGRSVTDRADTVWNTTSIDESLQAVRDSVPENTVAFGVGMPEICYQLGWDPQVHMMDWTDDSSEAVHEDMVRVIDEALISQDAYMMIVDSDYHNPDFELTNTIKTNDFIIEYYERIR